MDSHSVIALLTPKYLFLALIYLALFLIVGAVRQEMKQHLKAAEQPSGSALGRLKLIKTGNDPRWQLGQLFPLQPQTTLGKDIGNTITLNDPFVSSQHARLRWDDGKWWIEDLGSTNGTFLNDQRCPPHQPLAAPANARLGLGDMVFLLQM